MYDTATAKRIRQGDILEGLAYQYFESDVTINFKYIVVLSQDCDLESDFRARQDNPVKSQDSFMDTVLICPAFIAEELRMGTHLSFLDKTMEPKGKESKTTWNYISTNRDPRYHYLESEPANSLPGLVIDFKQYYTISRGFLYGNLADHFKLAVGGYHRELLSQRFAFYLSRVAIPTQDSIA